MYNSAFLLFSSDSGPAEFLPVVEVADVDEGVEEFHYVNAALSLCICILERGQEGRQATLQFLPDRQR